MKYRNVLLWFVLFFFIFPIYAKAATLTVGSGGETYTTINAALAVAVNGDTILVSNGIYNETIDFNGLAITIQSVNGAPFTTINGGASGSVITFKSGETSTSVLDGFTITNGTGYPVLSDSYGGGIYCYYASPIIQNCTITGNSSITDGGGIYCKKSSPQVTNCTIMNNTATTGNGGGIYSREASIMITNCSVNNNTSTIADGGGIYCVLETPFITGGTVTANIAGSEGGGIICLLSTPDISGVTINGNFAAYAGGVMLNSCSTATIANCSIVSNSSSTGQGGGIYSSGSSPAINNCTITGNTSPTSSGGGIHIGSSSSAVITNCTITENTAISGGGLNCSYSSLKVINCTVSENAAVNQGGGAYFQEATSSSIINSIFWGDTAGTGTKEIYLLAGTTINVSYSDIEQSLLGYAGTDNINSDPLFVSPAGSDFHLKPGSPCIDTADDGTVTGETIPIDDFESDPRPQGNGYDMGADESPYKLIKVPADSALIQPAIISASVGDTILVSAGTYVENLDYSGKDIIIRSESGPESTIIDGGGTGVVFYFHAGESSAAVLDGFTITNGNSSFGGGIYCTNSSAPTITGCIVTGNTSNYASGIYCSAASPTIAGCTISYNTTSGGGAGISCTNSSPVITNCTIIKNTSTSISGSNAGGIYCYNLSSPTITNCTFVDNTATSASFGGGGILVYISSSPVVKNCIFWGNKAGGSSNEISLQSGGSITVTYSDIQQASVPYTGTGNINSDPLFADSPNDDYHLSLGSPCIDTGTLSGAPSDDIDSDLRPKGSLADMGSDEAWWTFYVDSDGDGYGDNSDPGTVSTTDLGLGAGYSFTNDDCDDLDPNLNPATVWYKDSDSDGYSDGTSLNQCTVPGLGYAIASALTATYGDCDDNDAAVYPGAVETADDGIDQNCNGYDFITYYVDSDGDGYGDSSASQQVDGAQPTGYSSDNTDCDDTDATINPGATEIENDGIDQDCNGSDLTTTPAGGGGGGGGCFVATASYEDKGDLNIIDRFIDIAEKLLK